MFGRKVLNHSRSSENARLSRQVFSNVLIEALEDRRLLSASVHHVHAAATHAAKHHAATTALLKSTAGKAATTSTSSSSSSSSTSSAAQGQILDTILFSEAPSAVQSGLTTLASSDSLASPASTQTVYLGNSDGIETYSLVYNSSGSTTRITVDQNGKPVTAPTESTTTWATLSGTGTGSDAAAASEITAIATALGLTAPTSSTTVDVKTASDGTITYNVRLSGSSSSTSTSYADGETTVSVDSSGNPVGHQELPFSVMPAAIQNGINAHLPSGVSALSSSSTQNVDVLTASGKTFYSTTFTSGATTTTITVDATGATATLPSTSTTTYADLQSSDLAAAAELQTLATDQGAGTISSTQSITVYDEGNGTTIYSVTLTATNSTTGQTFAVTISVDEAGNPTVPPNQGHGGCGGDEGEGGDGLASSGREHGGLYSG